MTAEQGRPDLPCPNRVDVRIGFIRLEAVFDVTVHMYQLETEAGRGWSDLFPVVVERIREPTGVWD